MEVIIAAVGRDRSGPARELFDEYSRRSPWRVRLIEITSRASQASDRRLDDEAERLLRTVPKGALVIALDESGLQIGSAEFARRLDRWQEQVGSLVFVIGGADGLADSVLARADATLAFGRMTWPHRLVRVMLAEQIYRAGTILAGHPYHRA